VEYFNYLGSQKTDDARCMCEIQQEDSFHQQIAFTFKEETSEVLHLEHRFVWCQNLNVSESRSEIL
jgi:hypothetical protein